MKRICEMVSNVDIGEKGLAAILVLALILVAAGSAWFLVHQYSDFDGKGAGDPGEVLDCTPGPYHSSVSLAAEFDGDQGDVNDQYFFMFTPTVSFEVSEIRFEWRKTVTTNVDVVVEIWSVSGSAAPWCPVTKVAYGSGTVTVKDAYTWFTVALVPGVLQAGEKYGVRVSTNEVVFAWKRYKGSATGKATYHVGYSGGSCSTNWGWSTATAAQDYAVVFVGCYAADANVTTVPAYFSAYNQVVLQGMVNAVGYDIDYGVNPQFQWGFAADVLSEKYRSGELVKRGGVAFEMRLTGLPLGETMYFRAGIYGLGSEVETWGSVLSFQVPATEGAMLEISVVENSQSRIVFEVQVNSLGGAVAPDVKLYYGDTMAGLLSGNSSVIVSSAIAGTGRWSYTDNWTVFDDGQEYWVRVGLVVGGEVTAHSDVIRFVRYDNTQPGFINWLGDVFGVNLEWLWGILVLVGLAVVWLFAMTRARPSTALGIVGSFAVLGLAIAFGFVDAWVVVLLAIVAGWVIFKVVFKGSGGTG